jgi:hypothetical protein
MGMIVAVRRAMLRGWRLPRLAHLSTTFYSG